MKLLKNRSFLSVFCTILAAVVSFLLLPRFYADKSATVTVLRAAENIPTGTEFTEQNLVSVEVGSYGLPEGVLNDKTQPIGKVAQTDIAKGDYLFSKKVGDYLFSQKVGDYLANELLDRIVKNNQRLVNK